MRSEDTSSAGFEYSEDEWRKVLFAAPDAEKVRFQLERAAGALLASPTAAQVREENRSEYDFQVRLNEAAAALLDVLSEAATVEADFIQRLEDYLTSSEQMIDALHADCPHANRLLGWNGYLETLCQIGHESLGFQPTQRRRLDNTPYGAMIEFLVAAASPVKARKGPLNLTGPMTAETAHRAMRTYASSVRERDDPITAAIVAAVMARHEPKN